QKFCVDLCLRHSASRMLMPKQGMSCRRRESFIMDSIGAALELTNTIRPNTMSRQVTSSVTSKQSANKPLGFTFQTTGLNPANFQWVWHVNWLDEPEKKWNRFENYFPGETYCDWVALSAYGPTTPMTRDGTESFAFKMREAYPRLVKIAPGKPIIIAEFGCDLHNPHVDAATWAKAALEDLFSSRWPGIVGFCWWNEGWQNDNLKKH